ncbi:TPA: hypothetical protein TZW69_000259 [Streptococcus suis]|uniref:Uncharacterized protein n=1 Tax=Streptococcus suis TaxID=1307 RepID=A0A0Z8EKT0_STRSU|nr:hypothetical protein [Streptococcus suis]MCQ8270990.1 hypothetical protein [Streptococcus suis]MCQ8785928.1 hypothetical protein [Streptococcus suis]MDW8719644.1 hypothetical protein [Streptococcus suis]MDY7596564.1 hypothetical protein [Streptococcus suis]MEE3745730.1 hypothetical protein [Streptococcus suis]
MVKNISKRLERLQELASQKKEVSVEDALILWIKFIDRLFPEGDKESIELPDYFTPPFGNVTYENYERARKELEEYDRKVN